jgi:uncharacterized repeat protein (TIGR03833 family)
MDGKNRKDIKPGLKVNITQKPDQRSGKLTSGIVKDTSRNPPPTHTASRCGSNPARWGA